MKLREPKGFFEYLRIKKLYKKAFPRCERKPFSIIKRMKSMGKTDIWYFSDEGGFVGFAATINGEREVLIDYLAIDGGVRGRGHGTAALSAMLSHYSPRGVFLEIEIPYEDAENYEERSKRRRFYLNAGLAPMNTYAKLFGVDMELLGVNCHLDYDEYKEFYLENYGRIAYDNITPIERKM